MELMLNLLVPLFCVLAHQRSFWVYVATAIAGAILLCLQLIRSLSLPKLRRNAKHIMLRLLSSGGIRPHLDFVVRDDSFWLDWMSEGLVAIGESYVGCLWATNASRTLDDVVARLLTIPMEGRQEMYRSWSARFVALAARMFKYSPSSMGLVVGAVSEQFDLCPEFRRAYMDRYLHQGFGVWTPGTTTIDVAQANKLAELDHQLAIQSGHTILDISIGSWGGVGCHLAQKHSNVVIVSILSSIQELARAKKFAHELKVVNRIEFVLAETPQKLLTLLSGFCASRFNRITLCGVLETTPESQQSRLLRTLKRIQKPNGLTLLEFSACTATHMATHAWTNKYVHGAYPCYAITLPMLRQLARATGFTLRHTLGYSDNYERTFLEWNRRFQAQYATVEAVDHATIKNSPMPSLPESFKRTWEFYLLHSAACYRSGALQVKKARSIMTKDVAGDAWEEHVDEASGLVYYHNVHTNESTWENPVGLKPFDTEDAASKWRKFVDEDSGMPYYYDEVNGISRWDKPKNFDLKEKSEMQHDTDKSFEEDAVKQQEDELSHETEAPEQDSKEEKEQEDNESTNSTAGSFDKFTGQDADTFDESPQWVKVVDIASQKPYYYNASTGKTQWEVPDNFKENAKALIAPQISVEYQAYLNKLRTERLVRVTQHVLDPSGNLFKLNALLNDIDKKNPSVHSSAKMAEPHTNQAEWQQHIDAQTQRYYFHNVVTGVTQWTKPDAPIVSGLADWLPPEILESNSIGVDTKIVSGVNYIAQAKFNRLTGKYEQLGGDEYWQHAGIASDRAGRQMSHFFDVDDLEKNREEARRRKEKLKRSNIDWKKVSAEKKAKKLKQRNEWLFND